MKRLITLIVILLATMQFTANGQIITNNFTLDKVNAKSKKGKRPLKLARLKSKERAAKRKADAAKTDQKSKNELADRLEKNSTTQEQKAAADDARKEAENADRVNDKLANKLAKAHKKAAKKANQANNAMKVHLKLKSPTATIIDTTVEAETAPADADDTSAIEPEIAIYTTTFKINQADAGDIDTVTAVASDTTVNKDWTGFIFGTGTVSDLQNPANPNSNLSIGGIINYRRNTLIFAYNPKAATSTDTGNLIKSFLFPEITARAFTIEYDRALANSPISNNGNASINFFMNLSTSYIESSSTTKVTPYNMLTGIRFTIHKDLTNESNPDVAKLKNLTFSVIPHFSLITIDPKDFDNYDSTFKPSSSPDAMKKIQTTLQAVGTKVSLDIGSLHIFFDYKYIINGGTNQVFNTGYYTLGAAVNTNIFSFQ